GDVVGRVQVDLLLAEFERGAALAEMHDLHPEHLRIEVAGLGDIGDGQHQMIEAGDLHANTPEGCGMAGAAAALAATAQPARDCFAPPAMPVKIEMPLWHPEGETA